MKKIAIVALIAVLLAGSASAGYSPGWSNPVEADGETTVTLTVFNTYNDSQSTVNLSASPEISDHVEIQNKSFTLAPSGDDGDSKQVDIVINPQQTGMHNGSIVINQTGERTDGSAVKNTESADLTIDAESVSVSGAVSVGEYPMRIKIFGALAALSLIGAGVYFYQTDDEDTDYLG